MGDMQHEWGRSGSLCGHMCSGIPVYYFSTITHLLFAIDGSLLSPWDYFLGGVYHKPVILSMNMLTSWTLDEYAVFRRTTRAERSIATPTRRSLSEVLARTWKQALPSDASKLRCNVHDLE
jgi:hypothetical protein